MWTSIKFVSIKVQREAFDLSEMDMVPNNNIPDTKLGIMETIHNKCG